MGREQVEIRIVATVSRHNSPQDKLDDWRWTKMCGSIEHLIESSQYNDIQPMIVQGQVSDEEYLTAIQEIAKSHGS